jgi:anti-anti-sigma factor
VLESDSLVPSLKVALSDTIPRPFGCTWSGLGANAASVHVAGELDLAAVPRLTAAFRDLRPAACLIVLDLRELTFLAVAGVRAIVEASVMARREDRRVLLARVPPCAHRVFALTGTSEQIEVVLELELEEEPLARVLPWRDLPIAGTGRRTGRPQKAARPARPG